MYLKVTISSLPQICFAHRYSSSHYHMHFPVMDKRLEIALLQEGDTFRRYEDERVEFFPAERFHLSTYKEPFSMHSRALLCRHITVAWDCDYTITKLTREQLLTDCQHRAATPSFYISEEGLELSGNSACEALLTRLIDRFALPDMEQSLYCAGLLYEFLAAVTGATVRAAVLEGGGLSPAGLHYAQRAVQYIADHLSSKLTVESVAAHLGISAGYLSMLFKAYTGASIVRYANAARIEKLRELLLSRRMSLRQAGESVGLGDENYCSRLFRQYTGQSVRDFLRQHAPRD